MAFYVKLGPRGLIFRLGTLIIGVVGGIAYRRAFRQRALGGVVSTSVTKGFEGLPN